MSPAFCGGGRQAIYHPIETSFTCQVTCFFLFKISCPGIQAVLQKKGSKVTVFPPQWEFKKEAEKWILSFLYRVSFLVKSYGSFCLFLIISES